MLGRVMFKYAVAIIFLATFSLKSFALESETEKTLTNSIIIDGIEFTLKLERSDKFGSIGFYQHPDRINGLSLRITKDGKRILSGNGATGDFYRVSKNGKVTEFSASTEKWARQHFEKTVNPVKRPSLTTSLAQAILSIVKSDSESVSSQSSSSTSYVVDDNVISVAFVVDFLAHREMFENQLEWGITPSEQMQSAIDKANLILVNSGITSFSVELGSVIYRQQWESADLYSKYVSGDSEVVDLAIPFAMANKSADRILMLPPEVLVGRLIGLSKQWQFDQHDADNGALYSQYYERVLEVSPSVLPTFVAAHELGHTMGLAHERALETPFDNAIPYGYTSPSGYFTAMSLGSECSPDCTERVDIFSNPSLTQGGEALGVDDTQVEAANATDWLQNAWPQTTDTTPSLAVYSQSNDGANNSVSWLVPDGTLSQTLYYKTGECPDRASPFSNAGDSLLLDASYTVVNLSASISSYTLPSVTSSYCVITTADFSFQNATLTRPIAIGPANIVNNSLVLDSSTVELALSQPGQSGALSLSVSDTNLLNSSIELHIQDRSSVSERGVSGFTKIEDSSFAGLFTLIATGSGAARDISITLSSDLSVIANYLKATSFGLMERRQLPVQIVSGTSTHNLVVDIDALFANLPSITVTQDLASFNYAEKDASTIKSVIAIVENVDSAAQIQVSGYTFDTNSTWDIDSFNVEDLGAGSFRVTVSALSPTDPDSQTAALIEVQDFGASAYANFMLEDWITFNFPAGSVVGVESVPFEVDGVVDNLPSGYTLADFTNMVYTGYGENLVFSTSGLGIGDLDTNQAEFSITLTIDTVGQFEIEASNELGATPTTERLQVNILSATGDEDSDGVENQNDAFPVDPTEWLDTDLDGIGNNTDTDDDGDGMPDTFEQTYGLNSLEPADAAQDSDNDGLSNLGEFNLGTNPQLNDTDGDGILDGSDTDPLDDTVGKWDFLDADRDLIEDIVTEGVSGEVVIVDAQSATINGVMQLPTGFTDTLALSLPDITGNAVWELLILGDTNSGSSTWGVFDGASGELQYLNSYPSWLQPNQQIDAVVVGDENSDDYNDFLVLVENSNQQNVHALYSGLSGDLLRATILPTWFSATAAIPLNDFNANGVSEVAIIGETTATTPVLLRYDTITGANLGNISVPGWFTPLRARKGNDINSNGVNEIVLSGTTTIGAQVWLAIDGRTGSLAKQGGYPGWISDREFRVIGDDSGDGIADILVLGETVAGNWLLRRNDINSGVIQSQVALPGWLTPLDIKVISDANNNGSQDVLVFGTSPANTTAWRIYDGMTGAFLFQAIPPQ